MSSLNVVSIQNDETNALRSIFAKEFKLLRPKNKKKKFEPPCYSILIVISKSVTKPISLRLIFDCLIDYPISSPKISITEPINIPNELSEDLIKNLNKKALDLNMAPMIHNLVEDAREILLSKLDYLTLEKDLELLSPNLKHIPSVNIAVENYDDIIKTENKQSEMKLKLLQQRRDSAQNENIKEKRFEKCFHNYQNSGSIVDFSHCKDKMGLKVYKGVCEGEHKVKTINRSIQLIYNVFEGFNLVKGSNIKINQITIPNLTKQKLDYIKSDWLMKLEEDFSLLFKLDHRNILPYIGFQWHTYDKQIRKKKTVDLNIQYITPNCGGITLTAMCDKDISGDCNDLCNNGNKLRLPITKIKGYMKNIVDAMQYLHEKNITCIKTNMNNILVDNDMQLKLCHYCIGKRFDELRLQPDNKLDEQTTISTVKKGSKRHDAIKVGKLAEKLFYYGLSELEMDESEMPSNLVDFISCLTSNIEDMHNHPFLCKEQFIDKNDNDSISVDNNNQDLSPWKLFEKSSRIPREFQLICSLGKGAFGDVVKAKNIYDNQFYAIKRVRLHAITKKAQRTMKEVQLLSSLNHENIVRYYASWCEKINIDNHLSSSSSSHNTKISSTRNNISDIRSIKKPDLDSNLLDLQDTRNSILFTNNLDYSKIDQHGRHFDLESYSDSDSDSSTCESVSDDDNNDDDHHDNSGIDHKLSSVDIVFGGDSVHNCQPSVKSIKSRSAYVNQSEFNKNRYTKSKHHKYLMIQMQLCEGPCNTLQKCIDEQKLYLNEKLIWRFIREIVSGLEHIHSKNMIHRDLKPNNIFLDHQKRVKIGDLGLAMDINVKVVDNGEDKLVSSEKGPVGTAMYICPEMMAHKSYSHKADMYSLGIIIFEMCHPPFSTTCERYHTLNKLRHIDILLPDEEQYKINGSLKDLIRQLLNHEPSQRPSASELLKSNIIPTPEGKEMEYRQFLIDVTKTSNSNFYKLNLKSLFSQLYPEPGRYELPLLYQSPFQYYYTNTKGQVNRMLSTTISGELDDGNYTYFAMKRSLHRHIETVFICHGAVEFMAPTLSPNITKNISTNLFTLLDSEGVVVNLPNNLRDNFANFLINHDITTSKRYAIGTIYQHQEYRRDHPRELVEAAFDIVTDYENTNKNVEMLYIVHQIFVKLFNFEHVILNIEINHTELVIGILNFYKIPTDLHHKILWPTQDSTSSNGDYLDSEEFKKLAILKEYQKNHLKTILEYNGSLNDFEKHLKIFQNKVNEVECCDCIMKAFYELQEIEKKLINYNDNCCFSINIRPIVIPYRSIYRGFVFQLVIQVQHKLLDIVKYNTNKNNKIIMKYLKTAKKLGIGGDYSSFLMTGHRPFYTVEEDIQRCISAIGMSIDLTTLLQCIYSIKKLSLSTNEPDILYECLINCLTNIIVQYDSDNDKIIQQLLVKLWTEGLAAELYDKDDRGEEYAFNNKINFFIKFHKHDKKSNMDNRIFLKKYDGKSNVLELIFADDIRNTNKIVEFIAKELKKTNYSLINRNDKEYTNCYQRQTSDSTSMDNSMEIDIKRNITTKTESSVINRYIYKFIGAKDKFNCPDLSLNYFVETSKHMQSLNQKYGELDTSKIVSVMNVNTLLSNSTKWFQGKFPNPLYNIIAEISYAKLILIIDEVSIKSLKDNNKLSKIFNKIETSKNYSINFDKQWKDVLARIWEELQNILKEKLNRVVIYSQIDDNFVLLDIK